MAKKEFSDETRSRLSELYSSFDDIINKNVSINLYGQNISFKDVQTAMRKQPFITSVRKNSILELNDIDEEKIKTNLHAIETISKGRETVVMEMVLVEEFDNVKFLPSEIQPVKGVLKLLPPRMTIDLSKVDIQPYHGVRINTGYSIRIPSIAVGKTIENGKILSTPLNKQIDVVIVPTIVQPPVGLIQALYARDPEDSGLLTINFTTTSKINLKKKLCIVFNAYATIKPLTSISIVESQTTTSDLFKPKDSQSGRLVKNPKVKFHADSFDTTTVPGSLLLKTFDNTKKPSVTFANQKIKLDQIITLFPSRKREWCNPNLVTFAGLYDPSPRKLNIVEPTIAKGSEDPSPPMLNIVEPIIAKGSEVNHNTHGMVFITHKVVLFSVPGKVQEDVRMLNGSFSNLKDYENITKKLRQLINSLFSLSVGAKTCRQIVEETPSLDINKLIVLYDYHRSIDSKDVKKLAERSEYSEKKMFDERPSQANAYSSSLYKAFKYLAYTFCANKFTPEQLEELSLSCVNVKESMPTTVTPTTTDVSNDNKRRRHREIENDKDAEEPVSKRLNTQ